MEVFILKRRFTFVNSLIFSLLLVLTTILTTNNPVLAKNTSNEILNLDLYLINDFHGNLRHEKNIPGSATLVSAINALIAQNPQGSLLLGGGDMIQGTLESSLDNGLPTVKVLNEFGFDACVLGNHEFNYPKEVVKQQLETATFPFLSANIVDKNKQPIFKPYVIIKKSGVKIAIIGLTTMETTKYSRHAYIKNYTFLKPKTVVPKYLKEVRKKGADIVVLLTHIGSQEKKGEVKGEIIPVLKTASNIDAVFTAHSHKKVATKYKNIPVLQAGCKGKYIGKIHFVYSKKKRKVLASTIKLYPIRYGMYPENKKVNKLLKPLFKEVNLKYGEKLALNKHYLNNESRGQSALGELLTDFMVEKTNAQISFLNAGSIRYNLEKGLVTTSKLKKIFPYSSDLITMNLKGSDLIKTVEHGLELQSFGFLRFSGLKVTADMAKPLGHRIVEITTKNGEKINPNKTYFIAVNNFLAEGGDNYSSLTKGTNIKNLGNLNEFFKHLFIKKRTINYISNQRLVLLNYTPSTH